MTNHEKGPYCDPDSDSLSDVDESEINDPYIDEDRFVHLSIQKWSKTTSLGPHRLEGQLVDDHSPVDELVSNFNKLSTSSSKKPSHHPRHGSLDIAMLPYPYGPCVRSMDDLETIAISDMRLDAHHRGKKTTVRVLTSGFRSHITSVTGIVEDESGTAILLQLHQQPEESVVPAKEIMRPGDVFVVKEPYFESVTAGDYSLRVDHLGDLVRLEWDFEDRVPTKFKREPETRSSCELRNEGNQAVKGGRWAEALRLYTSAIYAAKSTEEEHLAYLNRSLANLRLGHPLKALQDAQKAGELATPTEKVLFRESRALYELGDFPKCLEKLQAIVAAHSATMSPQIYIEIQRTKARLHEQRTGEYDFKRMYKQAEKTPPLIDCANYSIAELRPSPGRGKGLFTKVPVKAGQIIVCEKAFSYAFIDEYTPDTMAMHLEMGPKGITSHTGSTVTLTAKLLQKMHSDPEAQKLCYNLCRGEGVQPPPVTMVDGHPITNTYMTSRILQINAYGSSRTSLECRIKGCESKDKIRARFGTGGVYITASGINHSCYFNCQCAHIGDMQIIRAARDLPAGSELFLEYRTPAPFATYEDVQAPLKALYGFTCDCSMCEAKKATKPEDLDLRRSLFGSICRAIMGNRPSDAYHIPALQKVDVRPVQRMLAEMEATYHGDAVRSDTCEPYSLVGVTMIAHHRPDETIRILANLLRALDFEVTARLFPTAVFRITRWGYIHAKLPLIMMNMFAAYECFDARDACDEVTRCAAVAYSVHVGEGDTMVEQIPEFNRKRD